MIAQEDKTEYTEEIYSIDDILAEYGGEPEEEPEAPAEENVSIYHDDPDSGEELLISDDDAQDVYADADIDYAEAQEDLESRSAPAPSEKPRASFKDTVINAVTRVLALAAMKIRQSRISLSSAPAEEAEDLGEELAPERAVRFYENYLPSLKFRMRLSFLFALILVYIAYGLPTFSVMQSSKVSSATCLVLMLCVMLCGIDILTAGILSLVRRRPHANSLVALSCVFTVIDALITAIAGSDAGLPFCAAAALTMAFSLLGSVLNARADRIVFKTAASSRDPYILSAESSVTGEGITLLKAKRVLNDFVRRTEEAGPDETAYGAMSPWLIGASLLLSLIVCIAGKCFGSFFRVLSGIFVTAAPITVLLAYPLPFFISSKRLLKNRSAIAGWSGLYDIGKSRTVIITDRDLFPEGTVTIEKVRVLDGVNSSKVISYAGSIIAASGCAMVSAFSELMSKGGGSLQRVDEFSCHESGGLIAIINGEEVKCGSAGFMQLMGIRLPEGIAPKYSVFVAVSGVVSGIFEMKYTPAKAVREALISLLRSNRDPVFAIRDFNINPRMLSLKFDIPTDGFDFPSFAERYEISSAEPSDSAKPAAIMYRDGLDSLTELADHGRRLFTVIRLNVLFSVLCTVIGMAMMFLAFIGGDIAFAGVRTVLNYMLLWLLPVIALCFALRK